LWISERDLTIVDVREGPDSCECQKGTLGRVWARNKTQDFLLGLAMTQLVDRQKASTRKVEREWVEVTAFAILP